jgi:hypothetical protein
VAVLFAVPTLNVAATIESAGVLGNSGEQGAALVRYGLGTAAQPAPGVGVAVDAAGTLWTRAGSGVLNRLSPDGRLLGQVSIPGGAGGWTNNDTLVSVGDRLVLKQGDRLHVLAPGGAVTTLAAKATRLSFGSRDGWLAAADRAQLFLVQPATGATKPLATLPGEAIWLEMGPDGAVYPVVDWKLHKLVEGRPATDGWPRAIPGERPQLVDGHWFGHAWHGTIRRFSAALEPAPGVVLGGASGSFIGHLDQNCEVMNGRGLARLRDGLYAVSGMGAVVHLLAWSPQRRQFDIVRRLGAAPAVGGLGLDRAGRVWWYCGSWEWDDAPDTPLRLQVNPPEVGVGQVVMLDDDRMVAAGWMWGKPAFYHGPLTGEVAAERIESGCTLAKAPQGAAAYRQGNQRVLLVIDAQGNGRAYRFDGRYGGDLGPVELKLASPAKAWTSLATRGDTLLAAVDGQVAELAREGTGWRETRRWAAWGDAPDQRFGARVTLAADAGRLWVADTERHRVLCFTLADGRLLASFGATDQPGDSLDRLAVPTTLAAREGRAVVYDAGNQRLVKLVVR